MPVRTRPQPIQRARLDQDAVQGLFGQGAAGPSDACARADGAVGEPRDPDRHGRLRAVPGEFLREGTEETVTDPLWIDPDALAMFLFLREGGWGAAP